MTDLIFCIILAPLLAQSQPISHIDSVKAEAAAGDTRAQVELGIAYASGKGVPPSDVEAVKWFRKAAEKGDPAGEYSLSEMYLDGRGVPQDLTQAIKWMRRSAEHGDPRGQSNLAAMYLEGQGVPKDEAEAAKWMQKAADQGFAAGQFGLGSMYAHGRGMPKDEGLAEMWYRKAADQGDVGALNNLAFLIATSTDPKIRNPEEAIKLAQKAVEVTNDARCLDTLARAYFEAGRADVAAETERQAVKLSPDKETYKEALKKYTAASGHDR